MVYSDVQMQSETTDFLISMGVILDRNSAINWGMNFKNAILEPNKKSYISYSYQMQVAKVIDTPNGPTEFQDALIGMIVPSYLDWREKDKIIVGQGITFINAAMIYMYHLFQKNDYRSAFRVIQYLKYFGNDHRGINPTDIWIISGQNTTSFFQKGSMNEEQSKDPYAYEADIFGHA